MRERVFITGIGVISGIGNSFAEFNDSLRAGRGGTAPITAFDASTVPGGLGCEVKGFEPAAHFTGPGAARMDRSSQLSLVAAGEAIGQAGFDCAAVDPLRVGVYIGTTLGGMINGTRYYQHLRGTGHARATLLWDYPLFAAGARIAAEFGLRGPNLAYSTACSSSNVAIGSAADMIRHGQLDAALAGGADTMAKITVAGFNALRNVSRDAIRPFDRDRSGLVLGEGAAIFVLESAGLCRRRGATPLAEVLGYGMSNDAYHMTAPDATGRGPALAMSRALANAGIGPDDISYVNAHGTGTRHNDETETRAIKKVFGERAHRIPVSSTKSMHGHALGATGALEAASIVAGIQGDFVPPTINFRSPDPKCDLDYVPNVARDHRITAALSNNFGFGGNNCSLVIGHHADFDA